MPDLTAIEQAGWHEAERRGAMLRALAAGRCRRNDAAAAAAALGLSTRQVYALVRRLRASGGLLTALVPRKPSGGRGRTRLAALVEAIVGTVIEEVWLNRQQRSIADTALEVRRRCLAAGLKAPAPSTIYRRVVALDPEATVRRRRGYEAARVFAPVGPSALVASRPLAVVQMDHTPVDLVIVDEHHRKPIGRAYLTVAIDVFSRCVAGFCLTLDPPSSVSVGLCLTHAVLPKEAWLAERGVEAGWPVLGLPAVLHVDNAPEFHGEALQRGCLQHGIELDHRPVARPHYGGIVERLIGCLMQLVHQLPGTTFSSPTDRVTLQVFCMRSMASGAAFHRAYPRATPQAFLEAHEHAFAYFGGVHRVLRYDNLSSAVRKILRGHRREETVRFVAFRSHWRFEAQFCTPAAGHEKGGVEGEVGYFRRNHWVPVPSVADLDELNGVLLAGCRGDERRLIDGRERCVGEALAIERDHLLAVAEAGFDLAEVSFPLVNASGCITVHANAYSVPLRPGSKVQASLYAAHLEVWHGGARVARHERCHGRRQQVLDLDHYLDVLERKPGAMAGSKPLEQWRGSGRWPADYDALWWRLNERPVSSADIPPGDRARGPMAARTGLGR